MSKMRKVLALLLTLATLLAMLPASALAEEEITQPAQAEESVELEQLTDLPQEQTQEPAAAAQEPAEEQSALSEAGEPEQDAALTRQESAGESVEEQTQEPAAAQEPAEEQSADDAAREPAAQETEQQSDVPESEEVFSVSAETDGVVRLLAGTSIKDAIAVTPGNTVENLFPIGGGETKDYYKLELSSPGTLSISGSSAVNPIDLQLLDHKGNLINDYPGINLAVPVSVELTKGTYYLLFKKTGAGEGVYSFTPTFQPVSVTESESTAAPNDSKDKASSFSLENAVVGHFSVTDHVDWYKFKLSKPGKIRFDAVTELKQITYDVMASDGFGVFHQVSEPDHITGEGRVSNLQADLIAGTYYLQITAPTDVGKYTFQIKYTPANETFPDAVGKCGNTFDTAHIVKANTVYDGQIAENSSADYFKFNVSNDKEIVELVAITKLPKISYRVYNKSMKLLKTFDSRWTSSSVAGKVDEKLPLAKGTYYLVAQGVDGFTGAYSIQLNCKNQFTPMIASATNVVGGIKLQWDDYGAASYRVFYRSGSSWKKAGDTTTTSFTFKNVKPNQTYTFTLRSMEKDGKTYTSGYDSKGYTIHYYAAPELKSVVILENGLRFVWKPSAGVSKYAVFYRVPKGSWKKAATVSSTNYVLKNVKNNTTYEFTVRCLSDDGKEYISDYNSKGIAKTFLSAPKIKTAKVQEDGIRLTWAKQEGVAKTRVFYKVEGTSKWIKLEDTTGTSVVAKKLAAGKTYIFTLRCLDKDGKTYTSNFNKTGTKVVYLKTPVLKNPTSISTSSAKVAWKSVAGAPKYRVFYRLKGAKTWTKAADVTGTSYSITGLKTKTDYEFTVRCISADGKTFLSGLAAAGRAFKTK